MSVLAAGQDAERSEGSSWSPDPTLILERESRVWSLRRRDGSIDPADALAMVVWPPKEALEEAAR